jgi:hypothetical protein
VPMPSPAPAFTDVEAGRRTRGHAIPYWRSESRRRLLVSPYLGRFPVGPGSSVGRGYAEGGEFGLAFVGAAWDE